MSNLPPIPEIGGDVGIILEVYTHASLRPSYTPMNVEYGDADRLAELGGSALDLSVTNYFYSVRPFLSGTEMQDRKNEITSDTNIDLWLALYRMKEKLKFAPTETHVLNDPVEMRKYFHTFLGAVVIRNGLPSLQAWVSALIDWSLRPSATDVAFGDDVDMAATGSVDGNNTTGNFV